MQVGAVIVAAGMSSRMGDFKPMLNIGSISIAQRIVATLHQAEVGKIVVITGHNANLLERHLANNGLIFLRNENYASTQMFDSAKIGLAYLKDKCERILFTPVDIPLFTALTVTELIAADARLACPVCDGMRGHPLMIDSSLVDALLADSGEGGLQGAITRCGAEMVEVPVDDPGILHDADTPADYRALLRYHNEQLVRPVIGISLAREKPFFDEKTAMLLSLVDETSSVRMACQRMQISYSTSWNLIRTLESQLHFPLLERSQGGAGGGESRLTEKGRRLLACYNAFAEDLRSSAIELFEKHFDGEL
ncbi:MAG: NTP transferase domain-containing protein [Oscillospiraceae bacterium]|nr:NTP transferase domain-containing protein [Oscillospiraceae bacterium]